MFSIQEYVEDLMAEGFTKICAWKMAREEFNRRKKLAMINEGRYKNSMEPPYTRSLANNKIRNKHSDAMELRF